MRKFASVMLFGLLVCTAVAAQEQYEEQEQKKQRLYNVTVEASADPLFIRSFLGDYAEREPSVDSGNAPFLYQGEGKIKSFQSSGFTSGMKGGLKLSYEDEIVGGSLELRSMSQSDYGTISLTRYVKMGYWDWNLWAKLFGERLRILAGNTAQRGRIEPYSNFDGFLKGNIDTLGIFYPTWRITPRATNLVNNLDIKSTFPYFSGQEDTNLGFADFSSTDTLDLFMPAGAAGRQQLGFLFDVTFAPVTVTASAGGLFSSDSLPFKTPWNAGDSTRLTDYDREFDPVGIEGLNFGFRVEGAKIADTVTVAAVYKYAESALNKLTAKPNDTLNYLLDETNGSHSFGVYASLAPFSGFGVTVGWSGMTQFWENPFYKEYDLNQTKNGEDHDVHWLSAYKEVRFPFYNGVDLRLNYTGIDKMNITFNNNVSFASVKGADLTEDSMDLYVFGWAYMNCMPGALNPEGGTNAESRTENYLGVYNALSAQYAVNDAMSLTAQAANRLGFFTLKSENKENWGSAPLTSITESLSLYAGINYMISRPSGVQFTIRTGLACVVNNYLYQFTDERASIQKAGYIDYGIPLSLAITF
jgi:hypothetical protein